VQLPVIGVGGIASVADALEFLMAGAAAVQLGTVNYTRPQAAREIYDGIAAHLQSQGMQDLSSLPIAQARVATHV